MAFLGRWRKKSRRKRQREKAKVAKTDSSSAPASGPEGESTSKSAKRLVELVPRRLRSQKKLSQIVEQKPPTTAESEPEMRTHSLTGAAAVPPLVPAEPRANDDSLQAHASNSSADSSRIVEKKIPEDLSYRRGDSFIAAVKQTDQLLLGHSDPATPLRHSPELDEVDFVVNTVQSVATPRRAGQISAISPATRNSGHTLVSQSDSCSISTQMTELTQGDDGLTAWGLPKALQPLMDSSDSEEEVFDVFADVDNDFSEKFFSSPSELESSKHLLLEHKVAMPSSQQQRVQKLLAIVYIAILYQRWGITVRPNRHDAAPVPLLCMPAWI